MKLLKINLFVLFYLFTAFILCGQQGESVENIHHQNEQGQAPIDRAALIDYDFTRSLQVVGEQVAYLFTPTKKWERRMVKRLSGNACAEEYNVEEDALGLLEDLLSYFKEE